MNTMNAMVDQLWFTEDQSTDLETMELTLPKSKSVRVKDNPIQLWAEGLGNEIGEFSINVKRRMIEDGIGKSVMPIFPHFIGAPEALILQEIYAHLGE